jgi:hypothetical protein
MAEDADDLSTPQLNRPRNRKKNHVTNNGGPTPEHSSLLQHPQNNRTLIHVEFLISVRDADEIFIRASHPESRIIETFRRSKISFAFTLYYRFFHLRKNPRLERDLPDGPLARA